MESERYVSPPPGMFDDIDLAECVDPSIPPGHVRIDGVLVKLPEAKDDE